MQGYKCYDPENPPMTLQIALVGTDGVLLVSDEQSNRTIGYITTSGNLTSKILTDCKRGLAACWSGYEDISHELATQILKLGDSEVSSNLSLGELAQEVYGKVKGSFGSSGRPYGDVLLVNRNSLGHVYMVSASERGCHASQYTAWVPSGQDSNSALFYCEKFYKRGPIDELIFLAAHTILTAGRIDPHRVRGLEILRCRQSGFDFVPEKELELLANKSRDLENSLSGELLRSHLGSGDNNAK